MLSLLDSEISIKGHIYKPFYLILGVFFFLGLLAFLGLVYSYYYIKLSLIEWIKEVKKERNKYSRMK